MHLLIPFAGPGSDAGRQALAELALPNLAAWLARCGALQRDEADELSLSPPHERALARACGLAGADGQIPWAAHTLPQDGRDPGELAWGLLTPCHWQLGTDQVVLADPAALGLDAAASRALFDAVHGLFESEGVLLVYGAPLRWYVAHESLAGSRCASLDRAIGRNVDAWLTAGERPRLLQRLLNEVQMTLHGHPLNEARETAGLAPVNALWLSGCGVRQRVAAPAAWQVDERLRAPALAEDWPAWCAAWRALDAGPVSDLASGDRRVAQLTLCGERAAATFVARQGSGWQRLARVATRWRRSDPRLLLESL